MTDDKFEYMNWGGEPWIKQFYNNGKVIGYEEYNYNYSDVNKRYYI